ncbi:titin-like [Palaemon carinicauda]|uniref:titin-like n=1 Tax=Palaemon carinicauda TaxID=392227 RepID=UPI0035B674DF
MARKWLRLLLVFGLASVLLQSTFCKGTEDNDSLTLDAWVAAIGAPAPTPQKPSSSLLSHRISHLDGEVDASKTKEVAKDKTEEHNEKETSDSSKATVRNSTRLGLSPEGNKEEPSSLAINKENTKANENEKLESTKDDVRGETDDGVSSVSDKPSTSTTKVTERAKLLLPERKNTSNAKETSTAISLIPDKASGVRRQPAREVSNNQKKEVTSSATTSVATSRMLLVTDGSTSPANLPSNVDMLKWRLTDSNLLDDIANLVGNSKDETKANPNRSGETSEDSKPKFSKAASEVVETRVLPPGDFENGIKKPSRLEQGSWGALSPKERILLRQKLMKDLETSYNVPLPSRIRYRLKKKPSVYTSKKPNTNNRFDIGIPDIYETEVQVTPKYRKKPPEGRGTVGNPENGYRGAADRSNQQYLPTPSGPSYVPLGALVTPAYDEEEEAPVTKPYIPLNGSPHDENSPGLVFRPPRRPPGINRRRTNGILHRPTPGRPYYFTTTSDRVSLQAHLQYRRPVAFKFKRTSNNQDYHGDSHTDPTTHVYTTEPYATPKITHHDTGSSPYHESTTAGYAKPPEKYIPPNNEYVPPKLPHQSHVHTASTGPHTGVSEKYHPPSKEYEAPKSTHPAPVTYSEPPQEYIPPSKEYIPPHASPEPHGKISSVTADKYHTPSTEYVTPSITHHSKEPLQEYIPPNKEYSLPHQEHKPHTQPLSTNYELPSKEYIPPKSSLRIPLFNPKSPQKDYVAPPQKYLPPNKEHPGTPSGDKHSGGDYTTPPRKYLPPNRTPENGQPHKRRRPGKRRRKHRKRPTPPSQKYLPPNADEQYDSEEHSEGKEPEGNYEPPNEEYIPPKAPSVTTDLPASHSTPARTYIPPVENYKAPHQGHVTPNSKYELPSNEYIPPVQPTTPVRHYETPLPTYGPPLQNYEPPSRDYIIPARPESHDISLPSWLMSLQGKIPSSVEESPRPYTINPTPPPGYHPKHSTREEYFPSTHPALHHSSPVHHHSSPRPGYHAPEPTYAPPDKEYHVPEVTYIPPIHEAPGYVYPSPKPGYHVTEASYLPSKPGYHVTEPSYLPSKPGYHAPDPTYAPPKADHHTVEDEYIPPKAPTPTHHSSPKPGYHAPEPTYVPPKVDYHTPEPEHSSHEHGYHYSSPKPGYHAPEPTYVPPHPGYHTPEPSYAPPKQDYHVPEQSYVPPRHDYHAPEIEYVPPKQEYHPPEHVHSTPKPGYPAPGLTYIPPKHEFPTPGPVHELHKPGYHAPDPTYAPPKVSYTSPEITYKTPKPGYHEPEQTYLGPKGGHPISSHPDHKPGYHAPEPTYKPPVHEHHHEAGYHAPKPTYKPPEHPSTISSPYSLPPRTYVPPVSEYLLPKNNHHTTPSYVPPKSPEDAYVPPKLPEVLIPKTPYAPPPPPPLHIPIDLTYLPPEREYHAPAPHHLPTTPSPVHSTTHVLVPQDEYIPPRTTPTPHYVAPAPPKNEYIPPPAITIEHSHDPPLKIPAAVPHVTTYKPNLHSKVQMLQDFSYPGAGKVSPHTAHPHVHGNQEVTTYSPPVYTPTTYGPGYNDILPSIKPVVRHPGHDLDIYDDYDDDYYYYYDDDDDYYYYYDDDDDDYYYYYYDDDYDYGVTPHRQPVPHHLAPQLDYDILDNEIYDFGYIAGIPGRAGRDYPILSYIPLTSFGCDLVADYPGYYADMEAGCQVFHICHRSGRQDSFLCPNGTIFNQKYFVCDWWYNFACEDAPFFYPVNAALGHPGVPLHRNAFEPDLETARNLPPQQPNQALRRDHLHLLNHVTTAVPHLLTVAPHHI